MKIQFSTYAKIIAITVLSTLAEVDAAIYTWDGSGGSSDTPTSGDWSANGNWDGGTGPGAGNNTTTLSFGGSGATSYASSNDISSTAFSNMILNSTATVNEYITGNILTTNGAGVNPTITQNGSGGFNISNNIYIAYSTIINGTGTGTLALTGNISGTGGLQINAANAVVVLSGANTFGGGATRFALTSGTVDIQNSEALGLNTQGGSYGPLLSGGTLESTTGVTLQNYTKGIAIQGDVTLGGESQWSLGTSAIHLTGATRTLTVSGNTRVTVGGAIDGATAVIVAGTGTMIVQGANTYTGGTTVRGKLLVDNSSGSGTGTGSVTIASGATLGGTGTIAPMGANSVTINGTLAPGDTDAGGTLNFTLTGTNKLALGVGSTLAFDLGGDTSDVINFTTTGDWLSGSGNATLSLTLNSGFDYSKSYVIFENVTTLGFTLGSITGYDSADYSAVFTKIDNNYVLSFVPEPSTWACLILGVSLLLIRTKIGSSAKDSLI